MLGGWVVMFGVVGCNNWDIWVRVLCWSIKGEMFNWEGDK